MPRLEFAPALPAGWVYSKLADASELISRGRSPQYVDHSHVRAIGQRCIRDSFDANAARGLNPNRLEGHLKALPGDVLLNSTGTGTIGRSCVFNDAGDFVVDSHVTVIRPQPKKLHPQWVNMLLRSPQGQTNLETFCYAGSTNQVELARTPLAETEIPLPPLREQRRIAAILDTLDRTIEGTQRVIEKLQATRQGLLHDLLTRGLDERGQLRDPERNPEQFKETELGRVPRAWAIKKMFDLVVSRDAERRPVKSDDRAKMQKVYPYYGASGIIDFVNDYLFDGTYVMLGEDGENILSRNLPLAFLARGKFWPNNHVHIFECTSLIEPEFMVELLEREDYTAVASGSAQPKITQGTLSVMRFASPPLAEQRAVLAVLSSWDARIQGEQAQLVKLQALKRGLMEDLLTGRVRVPLHTDGVEDSPAAPALRPSEALETTPPTPVMPPPLSMGTRPHAMYRAGAGANPQAMTEWTRQLQEAVQGQQVGTYSHAALDAVLPELLALSANRDGLLRVPELLARAGIRFMVLPHPRGSRTSGAAFYLDEPERTQPVVGLSLLNPYLDVFWFNLLHEVGHIRLGHAPVPDESLEQGEYDPNSPVEQAASAFARHQLLPEANWQPFLAAGLHDSNRIKRFAGKLGRHPAIVAGRLARDTGNWSRFNDPKLRPTVRAELDELLARLRSRQ